MVFSLLVPHLDFLSPSPHAHFLALFDDHTPVWYKRYKSDGFTIFYNDISIFNSIMNCLPIILSWSPQQDVTCLQWYHVAHNFINIFSNWKWNHNLFSHFHFTAIIQPLQSIWMMFSLCWLVSSSLTWTCSIHLITKDSSTTWTCSVYLITKDSSTDNANSSPSLSSNGGMPSQSNMFISDSISSLSLITMILLFGDFEA